MVRAMFALARKLQPSVIFLGKILFVIVLYNYTYSIESGKETTSSTRVENRLRIGLYGSVKPK